jgi:hypothetical protein
MSRAGFARRSADRVDPPSARLKIPDPSSARVSVESNETDGQPFRVRSSAPDSPDPPGTVSGAPDSKPTRSCTRCGRPVERAQRLGRPSSTCSTCGTAQPRVCAVCGKKLSARRRRLGRPRTTLCGSARCRKLRSAERRARTTVAATCLICRREFQGSKYRPGVVCSEPCRAALMSRLLRGKLRRLDSYTCWHCGRRWRPRDRRANKYCSRQCARRHLVRQQLLRGLGRDG